MSYIEWETANCPERYGRLRCNQVIDKVTLTHVICNVDCPEGVKREDFVKVMDAVAETLEKVPFVEVVAGKGDRIILYDDDTLEV